MREERKLIAASSYLRPKSFDRLLERFPWSSLGGGKKKVTSDSRQSGTGVCGR